MSVEVVQAHAQITVAVEADAEVEVQALVLVEVVFLPTVPAVLVVEEGGDACMNGPSTPHPSLDSKSYP